jgi:hypothetical protein
MATVPANRSGNSRWSALGGAITSLAMNVTANTRRTARHIQLAFLQVHMLVVLVAGVGFEPW